ncbi:MAG: isochorismate synthase, partial [Pseudolysinimonas sp.]
MTDLTVETRRTDPVASLIPFADPTHPLLFLRRGDGIAGLGEALRLEFSGPTRLADAAAAWREVAASAQVDDEVKIGGSGLVAFGAFAFDDASSRTSVLIVPDVVIGRRDGIGWVTRVNGAMTPVTASALG